LKETCINDLENGVPAENYVLMVTTVADALKYAGVQLIVEDRENQSMLLTLYGEG